MLMLNVEWTVKMGANEMLTTLHMNASVTRDTGYLTATILSVSVWIYTIQFTLIYTDAFYTVLIVNIKE